MKLAAVRALADLAHAEIPTRWRHAYGAEGLSFGPEYLIPKPFDPRLIERLCPAVAKAAMDSGVATRPIADMDAYRMRLRALRLPVRPQHGAGVRGRAQDTQAHRVRGG